MHSANQKAIATIGVFCSNQLGNCRQMDLSGLGFDVKLKERKEKEMN